MCPSRGALPEAQGCLSDLLGPRIAEAPLPPADGVIASRQGRRCPLAPAAWKDALPSPASRAGRPGCGARPAPRVWGGEPRLGMVGTGPLREPGLGGRGLALPTPLLGVLGAQRGPPLGCGDGAGPGLTPASPGGCVTAGPPPHHPVPSLPACTSLPPRSQSHSGAGWRARALNPWQVSPPPHGAPESPTHVLPLEAEARMIEQFKNRGEPGIN